MKRGRVVAAVVHAHEHDHGEDAGEGPAGLAADEGVGGVIALLRHDGGGGEDHDEADHHQQQGGEEDPLVDAFAFCHGAIFVGSIQRKREKQILDPFRMTIH